MLTSFTADRLAVCTPNSPIFRLGRWPNPWLPPEWFWAHEDRTFGNRFDDPSGFYRVLYASTQRVSCFIETLARFRPDISLVDDFSQIEGEEEYLPLGAVAVEWLTSRRLGQATLSGAYADIYSSGWVSYMRAGLAGDAVQLGLSDVDVSVLQQPSPRSITQRASRKIYERGLDGIFYRSLYGHDLENWALFEPFHLTDKLSEPALASDDADLREALRILGLTLL